MTHHQAPELQTIHWLNTKECITLDSLRGRVVLIETFQMRCPGCVSHSLPQAMRDARRLCRLEFLAEFQHRLNEFQRQRKHYGVRLFVCYFLERLKVTQLQRQILLRQHVSGFCQ